MVVDMVPASPSLIALLNVCSNAKTVPDVESSDDDALHGSRSPGSSARVPPGSRPVTGMSILRMHTGDRRKRKRDHHSSSLDAANNRHKSPSTPISSRNSLHASAVMLAREDAGSGGLGGGSSCHQCKSRRNSQDLTYCTSSLKKKNKGAQCRKKYCDHCLTKFYKDKVEKPQPAGTDWRCPSCRGLCCCAACRRRDKVKSPAHSPGTFTAPAPSPKFRPTTGLGLCEVDPLTIHQLLVLPPSTPEGTEGSRAVHPHSLPHSSPLASLSDLASSSPHLDAKPLYLLPNTATPARSPFSSPQGSLQGSPAVYSLQALPHAKGFSLGKTAQSTFSRDAPATVANATMKVEAGGGGAADGAAHGAVDANATSYLAVSPRSLQTLAGKQNLSRVVDTISLALSRTEANQHAVARSVATCSALTMMPQVQRAVGRILDKKQVPEWWRVQQIRDLLINAMTHQTLPGEGLEGLVERQEASIKREQHMKQEDSSNSEDKKSDSSDPEDLNTSSDSPEDDAAPTYIPSSKAPIPSSSPHTALPPAPSIPVPTTATKTGPPSMRPGASPPVAPGAFPPVATPASSPGLSTPFLLRTVVDATMGSLLLSQALRANMSR